MRENDERKLVTVRLIGALDPIPGADMIEVATIGGWKVVVRKGEFDVGDLCVYFEIDSFLPQSDERFSFIMKSGVRTYEGATGHRLRTVRLRGQISQGLALPLGSPDDTIFPEVWKEIDDSGLNVSEMFAHDFTEILGVVKWEPQIPAELAGQIVGYFPSWMRKTDQERCQNLVEEIFEQNAGARYEITLKLDGTSCTFYHRDGVVGVCSRNLELKTTEVNASNTLVKMLNTSNLIHVLPMFGNIAVQGELMGPGIQSNRERLSHHTFFIFDVQLLDEGRYMTPRERSEFMTNLYMSGVNSLLVEHVPIIAHSDELVDELGISSIAHLLKFADRPSLAHEIAEGVVFKRVDGGFSFKAINDRFLEEED